MYSFSGIEYIHSIVEPSPPSISKITLSSQAETVPTKHIPWVLCPLSPWYLGLWKCSLAHCLKGKITSAVEIWNAQAEETGLLTPLFLWAFCWKTVWWLWFFFHFYVTDLVRTISRKISSTRSWQGSWSFQPPTGITSRTQQRYPSGFVPVGCFLSRGPHLSRGAVEAPGLSWLLMCVSSLSSFHSIVSETFFLSF